MPIMSTVAHPALTDLAYAIILIREKPTDPPFHIRPEDADPSLRSSYPYPVVVMYCLDLGEIAICFPHPHVAWDMLSSGRVDRFARVLGAGWEAYGALRITKSDASFEDLEAALDILKIQLT